MFYFLSWNSSTWAKLEKKSVFFSDNYLDPVEFFFWRVCDPKAAVTYAWELLSQTVREKRDWQLHFALYRLMSHPFNLLNLETWKSCSCFNITHLFILTWRLLKQFIRVWKIMLAGPNWTVVIGWSKSGTPWALRAVILSNLNIYSFYHTNLTRKIANC